MSTCSLLRGKVFYALSLTIAICLCNHAKAGPVKNVKDYNSTIIKLNKKKFLLVELFTIVEMQASVKFAYDATELNIRDLVEVSTRKLRSMVY